MASESLSVDDLRQVGWWLHRVQHLRWVKTSQPLPEAEMVAECWAPDVPPGWAVDAAVAGEPGTRWCPVLCPDLAE